MPTKKAKRRPSRRAGNITKAEKLVVAQIVADSPAEVTPKQVTALAQTLRRSPEAIRHAIAEARANFNSDANWYVDAHKQAVTKALASEDPKALEIARKGAAWAMTNMTHEGKRIIDRPETGPQGSKILIGVRIGGIKQEVVEALPLIDISTDTHE